MEYDKPFTCTVEWSGDTVDYDNFSRTHQVTFPRGQKLIESSAGQALDPTVTNPEELFAASLGTCLMLTFLAVCSRGRINVRSYVDNPEAIVEFVDRRNRVTKVILHPEITVEGEVPVDRLNTAFEKAHGNCIISVSTKAEVIMKPVFRFV